GRALLALYQSTADRRWLREAAWTADYILRSFPDAADGGFMSTVPEKDSVFAKPYKDLDENISAVRFLNLLHHYTGKDAYKEAAAQGMRYLASEQITNAVPFSPGILLADEEVKTSPVHIVVVGAKSDPAAKDLYLAALRYPARYKQVEWYD